MTVSVMSVVSRLSVLMFPDRRPRRTVIRLRGGVVTGTTGERASCHRPTKVCCVTRRISGSPATGAGSATPRVVRRRFTTTPPARRRRAATGSPVLFVRPPER
ncbi:hypothetical protein GCM10010398_43590 [Streptomyces fimbriatus]